MKICALGAYKIRDQQLGFHWDGQARAFCDLGHDHLLLDIRRDRHNHIIDMIDAYDPDMLLLGLKDCLPLVPRLNLKKIKSHCKIVFWWGDLRGVEGTKSSLPLGKPIVNTKEIGKHIDYIFISNAGQLDDYKQGYNINNVYFMPLACTPKFHHRIKIKAKKGYSHDIGFAGNMDNSIWHRGRTALLHKLAKRYDVCLHNGDKNEIAEFYSISKLAFGAGVIGEDKEYFPELGVSNRFWIALGCGACLIHSWFPGIERIGRKHRDLLWFKSEEELYELADYYLKDNNAREAIKINAEKLAHSKHTYIHRIKNMIDIMEGGSKGFEGFLND